MQRTQSGWRITEDSIPVWEQRLREYVEAFKQNQAGSRERASGPRDGVEGSPLAAVVDGVVPLRSGPDGLLLGSGEGRGGDGADGHHRGVAVAPVTVTGPVEGGAGQVTAAVQDLAAAGYVEEEYFFSGEAERYAADGELGEDGRWEVTVAGTAPFTSRLVVAPCRSGRLQRRGPGRVVQRDQRDRRRPRGGYSAEEILREGHVWVGVSAQVIGARGPMGLVRSDPERYGSIVHPGEEYSFDIFTTGAQAVLDPAGPAPLGALRPAKIIAAGFSQSASYLTAYLDAVHPVAGVFDGFLVHGPLATAPGVDAIGSLMPRIRTDLAEPTMLFVTETDLTVYSYHAARQPDSDSVRTWEVAGAAHADAHLIEQVYGRADMVGACGGAINDGPHHQTLKAALHHLMAWVVDGTPPPEAPRIEVREGPNAAPGVVIKRDERGNALGGLRTPPVDVPVAALSGDPIPGGAGFCSAFGSTTPFDEATLAELYPTHEAYVDAYTSSLEATVAAGFILPPEADAMLAEATSSTVGV